MTTPASGPGMRRWRSRAFVQPLLVTIIGVAALPTIFLAPSLLAGPSSGSCSGSSCGYGAMAGLGYGLMLLAVWCVVMLLTGFVVGRSSRDSGLAFCAVLVAVGSLALAVTIAYTPYNALSFVDRLAIFVGLAIVPLISVGLGFGVGRVFKKRPSPAGSTGPAKTSFVPSDDDRG